MQLRMSPGGRTSNSRRNRPELPPSSLTVTTAVRSTEPAPALTKRFSPRSSVDNPVPPPIETILSGGAGGNRDSGFSSISASHAEGRAPTFGTHHFGDGVPGHAV